MCCAVLCTVMEAWKGLPYPEPEQKCSVVYFSWDPPTVSMVVLHAAPDDLLLDTGKQHFIKTALHYVT
jgi:hypothetical protein